MPIDDAIREFDPADLSAGVIPNRSGDGQATVAGSPVKDAGPLFDYLQINGNKAVRFDLPASGEFTYAAWFRYPSRQGRYHHALTFDAAQLTYLIKASGENFSFAPLGDFYHYESGYSSSEGLGIAGPVGLWFLFVAKYDGANLQISINGVNQGEPVAAGTLPAGTYSVGIPSTLSSSIEKHDFDLGPIRFYEKVLSRSEELELISYYVAPPEEIPSGQASKVSGIVQIDGTPAQRTVRAFGYNPTVHDIDGQTINLSKSLGHAISDPNTGDYTIDLLAGYDKRIFVVAFDDYGADFTPDMAVAVGDRVHPTTPNGHIWECTGAGTLPSEEPNWIVDTETDQLYGTASMIAKPFYRPVVHGPVTPEVVQQDPAP